MFVRGLEASMKGRKCCMVVFCPYVFLISALVLVDFGTDLKPVSWLSLLFPWCGDVVDAVASYSEPIVPF